MTQNQSPTLNSSEKSGFGIGSPLRHPLPSEAFFHLGTKVPLSEFPDFGERTDEFDEMMKDVVLPLGLKAEFNKALVEDTDVEQTIVTFRDENGELVLCFAGDIFDIHEIDDVIIIICSSTNLKGGVIFAWNPSTWSHTTRQF